MTATEPSLSLFHPAVLLVFALAGGAVLGYMASRVACFFDAAIETQGETGAAERSTDGLSQGFLGGSYASRQHVVTACLGALLCCWLALAFGLSPHFLLALVLCWTLLCASLIDLKHFILPDSLTLPLLWAGLLINVAGYFATLQDAVIGAAAGYLALWSVYWMFKLLRNKEGLGHGDFKLTAALGAWLGWQALPTIILLAAFGGIAAGLILIAGRRMQASQPMPFGPFLAIAGFIALSTPHRLF